MVANPGRGGKGKSPCSVALAGTTTAKKFKVRYDGAVQNDNIAAASLPRLGG
jgi:hypothetical protein